jgi:parallel beta-helix repeat protein
MECLIKAIGTLQTRKLTNLTIGVLFLLIFASATLLVSAQLPSDTYTVINTNDSGQGTLRQAIIDANANPGHDNITFHISPESDAAGPYIIHLETLLPPVTDSVTIDGTSQPGYSSETGPLIEINGAQIDKSCAGVESGRYQDNPGLDIRRDNRSGSDASGTGILGLKISNFCQGIAVSADVVSDEERPFPQSNCRDTDTAYITNVTIQNNVIEGNRGGNGAIDLCHTENSLLKSNQFFDNGDHIEITRSRHVVVTSNAGVEAQDALELVESFYITIENNEFRETDRSGITLVFGAANNHILGNVIEDVATSGIILSDNNIAERNKITRAGWFGIEVRHGSNNILRANTVTHSGHGGIVISAAMFNFLSECTLNMEGEPTNCGVNFPLGEGAAFDNVITNNTVAFNGGAGIIVGGTYVNAEGTIQQAGRNSIIGNIIYANDGLAIDLTDNMQSFYFAALEPIVGAYGEIFIAQPDGPTASNATILANDDPYLPVLTQATMPSASSAFVEIKGSLDAHPNAQYIVSLYTSSEAQEILTDNEPFISSEGESPLFSEIVQTDAQGHVDFQFPVLISNLLRCHVTQTSGGEEVDGCVAGTVTQILTPEGKSGSTSEFGNTLVFGLD